MSRKQPTLETGLSHESVESLLQWFQRVARELPWRERRTPYRVWVSEIMLQQTQVDTVIPFYLRFLKAFPTVESLAAAEEDTLMAHWAGLGYYSRARNLQKAARTLVREHGGCFPSDPEVVRALPGFGEYTTAAVLSLSQGQNLAVLDGNVMRVLARVFLVEEDIMAGPTRRRLQAIATAGLPAGRAGAYNEALMELGATVCRPQPSCELCPLASVCRAYAQKRTADIPQRSRRGNRRTHPVVVLVGIAGDGRILLHRRPDKGMLAGLWELPNLRGEQELGREPADVESLASLFDGLERQLHESGFSARGAYRSLAVFRHHYSHFSVELHPRAGLLDGMPGAEDWRWVSPLGLDGLGVSASDRRILDQWLAE
ncbi:MAG: A/G-specific adenine glycosylase [Candidatus Cloacimonetes bacterium]|nr:A/G-specific adenine glycosylase [Candidatus Cloacimonadota bacterium]